MVQHGDLDVTGVELDVAFRNLAGDTTTLDEVLEEYAELKADDDLRTAFAVAESRLAESQGASKSPSVTSRRLARVGSQGNGQELENETSLYDLRTTLLLDGSVPCELFCRVFEERDTHVHIIWQFFVTAPLFVVSFVSTFQALA